MTGPIPHHPRPPVITCPVEDCGSGMVLDAMSLHLELKHGLGVDAQTLQNLVNQLTYLSAS